jgi:hypothetical protein
MNHERQTLKELRRNFVAAMVALGLIMVGAGFFVMMEGILLR